MADAIDLLVVIGTWLAVLLAFIALVGIVTPWLVLRALYSDRNRALLSIRDINQDFISRGIGYGPKHRLFRKITVPDLVPEDDWLENKIVAVHGAKLPWKLGTVRDTSCRTGWARFCRLLDAYKTSPKSNGELVIHRQQSFLPASRYHILAIGLLGRYGHREDGGRVFSNNPLRPDLDELRVLGIETLPKRDVGYEDSASESHDEDGGEDDEHEVKPFPGKDDDFAKKSLVIPPWMRDDTICGMTGSFKRAEVIPAADGSTVSSPLIFTLHNEEEMGLAPISFSDTEIELETPSLAEDSSITRLYWLASGFIPLASEEGWVACLQAPQGIESQIDLYNDTSDDEDYGDDENNDSNESDKNNGHKEEGENNKSDENGEDGQDHKSSEGEIVYVDKRTGLGHSKISKEIRDRKKDKDVDSVAEATQKGDNLETLEENGSEKKATNVHYAAVNSEQAEAGILDGEKKDKEVKIGPHITEAKSMELTKNGGDGVTKLDIPQQTQPAPPQIEVMEEIEETPLPNEKDNVPVTKSPPYRGWITLELRPTNDRPISIKETMIAFGMADLGIKSFHNTTLSVAKDSEECERLSSLHKGEISSGASEWIFWRTSSMSDIYWRKEDVQKLVFAVMNMDWHPWNFLIWRKSNLFWSEMLDSTSDTLHGMKRLLKLTKSEKEKDWHSICRTSFRELQHLVVESYENGYRKEGPLPKNGQSLLMQINEQLGKRALKNRKVRYIIAILFVTSPDFRRELLEHIGDRHKLWKHLLLKIDRENSKAIWTFKSSAKQVKLNPEFKFSYDDDDGGERDIRERKEFIYYDNIFPYDFDAGHEGEDMVYVEPTEALICLLLAATNCSLWLTSHDSRPLLEFVRGLEDVVHVG